MMMMMMMIVVIIATTNRQSRVGVPGWCAVLCLEEGLGFVVNRLLSICRNTADEIRCGWRDLFMIIINKYCLDLYNKKLIGPASSSCDRRPS